MSVSAGVAAQNVRDKLRGKLTQTKVKRYWPGRAPDWVEEDDEDRDRADRSGLPEDFRRTDELTLFRQAQSNSTPQDDARLRRLAESRRDRGEAVARHREIRAAEIVSTIEEERVKEIKREEEEREEEDEDAIEERRKRIREKLLQRQREKEEVEEEEEEEEEEEDEESEYETDDEEEGGATMIKPLFVPKAERDTMAEKEKLEKEEEALQEAVKKKMEERKTETKQLLVEEIKRDEEITKAQQEGDGGGFNEVDTDDETNEAEEYEAWKAREIARIRSNKEEREASAKEKEELERVRAMTEEERREWERRNPKQTTGGQKQKWKFMQKYYHKGAFFQDDADDRAGTAGGDNIFTRDFSAPTGEDKMDKSILPKVMQVKHFGRSGRTKWTHLVNEDTTQWDNPWTYNDELRAKYNNKMAGMNQSIARPRGAKKRSDGSSWQ
eukprot:TRINITY_DN1176_c0_g1_i1.p1 TRINITY_DN1176_c0_g1~~TRINITY_DN1176_c0_g1_i1.p1  ORF type:complete len:441 (-),score=126.37 TRINITY_DN1176_c0_g1_i1:600-1922(-)